MRDEIAELLPYLTRDEREELERLLASDGMMWRPLPGPQLLAYYSEADVLGYGGAAGGGKTDLAIGKALTQFRRTAIFREHATELTPVYDRINEIIGSGDLRDRYGRYRIPLPGGEVCMIEFGSLANPGDETKHQGHPKELLVLEEAANLREQAVRFLMGWVRSASGRRTQVLMTFNPPTRSEGRWIIDYFAPWIDKHHPVPAEPGELRWFVTVPGADGKVHDVEVADGQKRVLVGGRLTTKFDPRNYRLEDILVPKSRTFIPARVSDNIYLAGTNYVATLQSLPEPLRSQMLYGDFSAGIKDDEWQVIPTRWVEIAMERWQKRDRKPRMDSVGVDPNRGGDDNLVIARRHVDWWFDEPLVYPGGQPALDGAQTAGLVIAAVRDRAPIHIDATGIGASPYDFLVQAQQQVIGIIMGAQAPGADTKTGVLQFANWRSWLWWHGRDMLDPSANNGIALPPDRQLLADLTAPRWRPQGRAIYVESREELLKPDRLGRSPDYATAYLLAMLDTPRLADVAIRSASTSRGHDPYQMFDAQSYGGHDPYG